MLTACKGGGGSYNYQPLVLQDLRALQYCVLGKLGETTSGGVLYTFLQVSSYKVDPSHDDDEERCECLADEECCPRDNGITLKIVSTSMAALM